MTVTWSEALPTALPTALPAPVASGVYWQADEASFLLELPHMVRFHVSDGALRYARLGEVGEATVRMWGGGLPTAAAWVQKGRLALHAAAIALPAGAVIIAGMSGAGKSVLAATLAQRGFAILADEVTPVSLDEPAGLAVQPDADGTLLLWQDAVEALGLPADRLAPLRPGLRRWAVNGFPAASASLPLRAVYLLGLHNAPAIQATPLTGRDRVLAVIAASFNRYLPQAPDLRQRTFMQLTLKLAGVPMLRLLRPRVGWSAEALADQLVAEAAE